MVKIEYKIKLKGIIESKGLTQNSISEITGLSKSLISGFIRGKINPTEDEKHMIADALNVHIIDIF